MRCDNCGKKIMKASIKWNGSPPIPLPICRECIAKYPMRKLKGE